MSRPPLQNHKYIIYYKFEWLRWVGGHHHVLHPTFLFCAHAHPCVCCVLRVICFFSYFCAYEITFFGRLFPSSYHLSLHTTMHSLHPLSRLLISMCVIWLSCISQTPSCGTNFPAAYRLTPGFVSAKPNTRKALKDLPSLALASRVVQKVFLWGVDNGSPWQDELVSF